MTCATCCPCTRSSLLRLHNWVARSGLSEELAALCDPRGYAIDPEQAWQRVKGLRGLDPARTRVARALAAWREHRADPAQPSAGLDTR